METLDDLAETTRMNNSSADFFPRSVVRAMRCGLLSTAGTVLWSFLLDWLNGGLVGRVTGDLPDLTLLMEPGEWRCNGGEGKSPSSQSQPRGQPLRGAKP